MKDFKTFKEEIWVELTGIRDFVSKPISDQSAQAEQELDCANGFYGRLEYILPFCEFYLDRAEQERLVPKSTKISDMDRNVLLASAVAEERMFRNVVQGLLNSCEKRISSIQSKMRGIQNGR